MTVTGYSDRINHAFAFAAKHHDQQVRKGTRLPYLTQPANVAVILTRYGRDEATVVAGILHDTVEDAVREGWTARAARGAHRPQVQRRRCSRRCSPVIERRVDDDGVELSADDRKNDVPVASRQRRRGLALGVRGRQAAQRQHHRRTTWRAPRFPRRCGGVSRAGRDGTVRWYRAVCERLRAVGFDAPIVAELEAATEALERADG